jgi:hypothetical protein
MNIEKLVNLLTPWLQVDTWHTSHPCDEARYHSALNQVFKNLGTELDGENFSEAIHTTLEKVGSNLILEYRNELVDKFALRSENIANYLHFIK